MKTIAIIRVHVFFKLGAGIQRPCAQTYGKFWHFELSILINYGHIDSLSLVEIFLKRGDCGKQNTIYIHNSLDLLHLVKQQRYIKYICDCDQT